MSGIIPVFIEKEGVVRQMNRVLYARGLFVNIMEYPMVPPGLERIRVSVMSTHTREKSTPPFPMIADAAREFGCL